jgi:hypothetical protein
MAMMIELKPEQERILQDALRQGRFQSVEQALDEALQSIVPSKVEAKPEASKKSLLQFFRESPFVGMEMKFERSPDTGRKMEL